MGRVKKEQFIFAIGTMERNATGQIRFGVMHFQCRVLVRNWRQRH